MACELCAAVKWNLCQLSVSEQGTVDSCQRQHTPWEAKVGRQSLALKWKHTHFSFAPHFTQFEQHQHVARSLAFGQNTFSLTGQKYVDHAVQPLGILPIRQ